MYYFGFNFPSFRYYLGFEILPSVNMTNAFFFFCFSFGRSGGIVPSVSFFLSFFLLGVGSF